MSETFHYRDPGLVNTGEMFKQLMEGGGEEKNG
jgi:hypothetical protein